MKYIYRYRRPRSQRGNSTTADIVFVAVVMLAIFAFSFWYTRNVDRMVDQGCVSAGYASCSPWAK